MRGVTLRLGRTADLKKLRATRWTWADADVARVQDGLEECRAGRTAARGAVLRADEGLEQGREIDNVPIVKFGFRTGSVAGDISSSISEGMTAGIFERHV